MIADDNTSASRRKIRQRDLLAELRRRKFVDHAEHEIHGQLEHVVVRAVILFELIDVVGLSLANQYAVRFIRHFRKSRSVS